MSQKAQEAGMGDEIRDIFKRRKKTITKHRIKSIRNRFTLTVLRWIFTCALFLVLFPFFFLWYFLYWMFWPFFVLIKLMIYACVAAGIIMSVMMIGSKPQLLIAIMALWILLPTALVTARELIESGMSQLKRLVVSSFKKLKFMVSKKHIADDKSTEEPELLNSIEP